MSIWKTIGTYAIAGAAGGVIGIAGVAAYKGVKSYKTKVKDEARQHVLAEQKAKEAIRKRKEKDLQSKMSEFKSKFNEHKELEEFTLACFALAISAANCDGEIHKDEIIQIEEFISGQIFKKLPNSLRKNIKRLYDTPPTFNQALKYVEVCKVKDLDSMSDIIKITVHADGRIHKNESAFMVAWDKYKKTA